MIELGGRVFRRNEAGWEETFPNLGWTVTFDDTDEGFRTLALALDEIERLRAQIERVREVVRLNRTTSFDMDDYSYGYRLGADGVLDEVESALWERP